MDPQSLVIEIDVSSIADERLARPLLRFLELLPQLAPQTYDLNRKGLERAWDLDRAVVDLLTQRTQFFEVQGSGGWALIATGKHGEQPTLMVQGECVNHFREELLLTVPHARLVSSASEAPREP